MADSGANEAPAAVERRKPNILVTGTPGTGKSTLVEAIGEEFRMETVDVGKVVREHGFHAGRDEAFDTLILDDDSLDELLDWMEPRMGSTEGGVVVEHHTSEMFPERWFDLVLVVRCDNSKLFDRLTKRGYGKKKIEENISAEIFGVCAEEAKESYPGNGRVVEVKGESEEDMNSVLERMREWLGSWGKEEAGGGAGGGGSG